MALKTMSFYSGDDQILYGIICNGTCFSVIKYINENEILITKEYDFLGKIKEQMKLKNIEIINCIYTIISKYLK